MKYKELKNMRVAIVHDALTRLGGSINVLRALLKIFPEAHLYTSIDEGEPALADVRKRLVKKSGKLWLFNRYSFFSKLLIRNYWESLDFTNYDLVISSSDEFSSQSVITNPSTPHVSICYTPTRYLYYEYPHLDIARGFSGLRREFLLGLLRKHDFIASARPDAIIAISKTVQARIRKYYRRDSFVLYPPVTIPHKVPQKRRVEEYYIYIGALEKRKGLELAVKVFNRLGKKLIIAGGGPEKDGLSLLSDKNIVFTGQISERNKSVFLQKARGFIFPSIDEDFGIAPVEAMSYGVPVIAHRSGGVRETVIDGKTGVFFDNFSEDSMLKALKRFERIEFKPAFCYQTAKKFSEASFRTGLLSIIQNTLSDKKAFYENSAAQ